MHGGILRKSRHFFFPQVIHRAVGPGTDIQQRKGQGWGRGQTQPWTASHPHTKAVGVKLWKVHRSQPVKGMLHLSVKVRQGWSVEVRGEDVGKRRALAFFTM